MTVLVSNAHGSYTEEPQLDQDSSQDEEALAREGGSDTRKEPNGYVSPGESRDDGQRPVMNGTAIIELVGTSEDLVSMRRVDPCSRLSGVGVANTGEAYGGRRADILPDSPHRSAVARRGSQPGYGRG